MKDNKLIAEFMGISIDRELAYIEDEGSPLEEVMPVNNLNYHTSWDWLMPVIDKCYQEHMSKHIADVVMTCDIDKAYQAVVEFIKQYNK